MTTEYSFEISLKILSSMSMVYSFEMIELKVLFGMFGYVPFVLNLYECVISWALGIFRGIDWAISGRRLKPLGIPVRWVVRRGPGGRIPKNYS